MRTLGWEGMKGVMPCCSEEERKRRQRGALKLVGRQGWLRRDVLKMIFLYLIFEMERQMMQGPYFKRALGCG